MKETSLETFLLSGKEKDMNRKELFIMAAVIFIAGAITCIIVIKAYQGFFNPITWNK